MQCEHKRTTVYYDTAWGITCEDCGARRLTYVWKRFADGYPCPVALLARHAATATVACAMPNGTTGHVFTIPLSELYSQ